LIFLVAENSDVFADRTLLIKFRAYWTGIRNLYNSNFTKQKRCTSNFNVVDKVDIWTSGCL